jgi:phenylacetate-CoA ligase
MPFIRYKIEDIGVYSDKKCSCGIEQPLIKKIEGRIADFLYSTKGDLISGISLTDHFAGQIPGVSQIQIVQERIDLLILNVVKDKDYNSKSIEKIDYLVGDFFGKHMQYEINCLSEIEKSASGKFRFTICKLETDFDLSNAN